MLSSHSGDRADRKANVCKCKLPTKVTAGFRHLRKIKGSSIQYSVSKNVQDRFTEAKRYLLLVDEDPCRVQRKVS